MDGTGRGTLDADDADLRRKDVTLTCTGLYLAM